MVLMEQQKRWRLVVWPHLLTPALIRLQSDCPRQACKVSAADRVELGQPRPSWLVSSGTCSKALGVLQVLDSHRPPSPSP